MTDATRTKWLGGDRGPYPEDRQCPCDPNSNHPDCSMHGESWVAPPTVTVNYGPDGRYVVEFGMSGDKLMARYLPSPDGIGGSIPEAWEERAPAADDDAERVALLAALRTVLATYAGATSRS